MNFWRSIRFQLTAWYSLITLGFCLVYLIFFNVIIGQVVYTDQLDNLVRIDSPRVERRLQELERERLELVQSYRQQDLVRIRIVSAYSLIPLTIFSFATGYLITDQFLRPLQKLNIKMSQLRAQNLTQKIDFQDTGDEISELMKNFNQMTERIEDYITAQADFVSNASHELKTPLTIMKTNIEPVLVSEDQYTKKEVVKILETTNNQIDSLHKMIGDLLLLANIEEVKESDSFDLALLINEIKKDLKAHLNNKNTNLVIKSAPKSLIVKGNKNLSKQAIINIINNAVVHNNSTRPNIELVFNISDKKNFMNITIADNGPGIPSNFANKIFNRFSKNNRFEVSGKKKESTTGLGLAIAHEIMRKQGGDLILVKSDNQGSKFRMEFLLIV